MRAHEKVATPNIEYKKPASNILKLLGSTDKALLISVESSVRRYLHFSKKDFPVSKYKKDLFEMLAQSKKRLLLLKKKSIGCLGIDTEGLYSVEHKLKVTIEAELKRLKKVPTIKGRRPDFYMNEFIEDLLMERLRLKKSVSYTNAKVQEFTRKCLSEVGESISDTAIRERIRDISHKNKDLKKSK